MQVPSVCGQRGAGAACKPSVPTAHWSPIQTFQMLLHGLSMGRSSTASPQTARFCCAQHNKKEPEPDMQQHSHRWTTHPHTTSHRHMHAGAIAATTRCTSSNNSCPKTQQAWTTHLLRFVSQEVNLKSGSLVKLRAAKKHKQAFVQAWRCRDRGTACLLYTFPVAAGLEGSPESLPCCH